LRYAYRVVNGSKRRLKNVQTVTCVRLRDHASLADVRLDRTYLHADGRFVPFAEGIVNRLDLAEREWRSFALRAELNRPPPVQPETAPRNPRHTQKRGHKKTVFLARRPDLPVIATLSTDRRWVVATWSPASAALWTNVNWTCHHSDPICRRTIEPGAVAELEGKIFVYPGTLEQLVEKIRAAT
jgi:hypothetical protein